MIRISHDMGINSVKLRPKAGEKQRSDVSNAANKRRRANAKKKKESTRKIVEGSSNKRTKRELITPPATAALGPLLAPHAMRAPVLLPVAVGIAWGRGAPRWR